MSFLAKKFGSGKKSHKSKKAPQGPSTSEAIQQLRETEDILIKKQEFLENKIQQVMRFKCFGEPSGLFESWKILLINNRISFHWCY